MREKAFTFGDGATMVGVVTEPAGAVDARRPAVLVLNSGIIHRIGPARNGVNLARRLAREGLLTMRFDLSGIGDSEARRDDLTMEQHAVLDIRQAMDHLEKTRGLQRFLLIGLCSGADNAFLAAGEDPRVVGAVMMDGYGYRTPGYFLRHYGRRLLNTTAWLGFAKRNVHRANQWLGEKLKVTPGPAAPERIPQWSREFPPKPRFEADLRALVARKVQLYFIYTGAMAAYYNYRQQFMDGFSHVDLRGCVAVDFFADADHTFTELRMKRALADATAAWVQRTFPAAAGQTSAA